MSNLKSIIGKSIKILGVLGVIGFYTLVVALGGAILLNRELIQTTIDQEEEIQTLKEELGIGKNSSYREIIKKVVKIPTQPTQPSEPAEPPTPEYNYTSAELFSQVNVFRAQNDRQPLEEDSCLCELATIRRDELVLDGTLDHHKGFEDRDVFDRCSQYSFMGENLAQGYLTAEEVVFEGWEKSEGHRYAMDREEFTHACISTSDGISVLILAGDAS